MWPPLAAVLAMASCVTTIAQSPAGDSPLALPTRDVDVTYRSEHAGQIIEQRSRFDAASKRMRLDTPTKGLYIIVDYGAKVMLMVTEADHGVLEMPTPPGALSSAAMPEQKFLKRGTRQIAGNMCTEWETKDNQGQPVLTCFTGDGVLLSARRGDIVLAVATQVSFGPMSPALFDVPSGYKRLTKQAP